MRTNLYQLHMFDRLLSLRSSVIVIAFLVAAAAPSYAQHLGHGVGQLRVGVAQANITPAADVPLPMDGYGGRADGHEGVHDSLYTRVVVLESGGDKAAIVVNDLLFAWEELWETTSSRIGKELDIPKQHILVAGTHTHGGPELYDDTHKGNQKLAAYTRNMEDRIISAVHQAHAALEPARMGVGTGRANINVNRVARTLDGAWWIGRNPDGESDKTVHVVKFERLDGEPLAVLVNYAVHAVVMGPRNKQITADVAGATSHYVQKRLGGDVVVPWTSGAAGDQNPIYGPGGRFGHPIESFENLGEILGQEVVRVANEIEADRSDIRIRGAQKIVTVPGKERRGSYAADGVYSYTPADPINIRLSLLMLDYVALTGVAGEVMTGIGRRVKEESPVAHTIMITNANGNIGYVPTDAAYETPSYEVVSGSAVMSGAEEAVVDGLLELIDKTR